MLEGRAVVADTGTRVHTQVGGAPYIRTSLLYTGNGAGGQLSGEGGQLVRVYIHCGTQAYEAEGDHHKLVLHGRFVVGVVAKEGSKIRRSKEVGNEVILELQKRKKEKTERLYTLLLRKQGTSVFGGGTTTPGEIATDEKNERRL